MCVWWPMWFIIWKINKRLQNGVHKFHRLISHWLIVSLCESSCLQQASPSFTLKALGETCETMWKHLSFTRRHYQSDSYASVKLVKPVFYPFFKIRISTTIKYPSRRSSKNAIAKIKFAFAIILFAKAKSWRSVGNSSSTIGAINSLCVNNNFYICTWMII